MNRTLVLGLTACWFLAGGAMGQVPQLINYQGRLLDGANLYNGIVGFSLRLYNVPSGGAILYEDSNAVSAVDGLYSTWIGDDPASDAFIEALTNTEVYIEVVVGGTTLAPRERLVSAGYALATRGMLAGTNGTIVLNPVLGLNGIQAEAQHSTIAGGENNAILSGAIHAFLGGGLDNVVGSNALTSVIAGGRANDISDAALAAFIGGGQDNNIGASASRSAIVGGNGNDIFRAATQSFIGGGGNNNIESNAQSSVIAGGEANNILAGSSRTFIGGGDNNAIHANAGSSVIAGGEAHDIFANASHAFIGGGDNNSIGTNAHHGAIAGGEGNDILAGASRAFIGGGQDNNIFAGAAWGAIAGGAANDILSNATHASIGGGQDNNIGANALWSAIAGGALNDIGAGATRSFLGGGYNNNIGANATHGVISGGFDNNISSNAPYAVIPGGNGNAVGPNATNAFAAGRRAKANHGGAFVWGDDSDADVASSSYNETTFRSSGGFRIFSSAALTSGVQVAADSGAWTSVSDVNAKEGFDDVKPREVLEKVAHLPITTWRYKGQQREIRHMGPTAQDFAAAFGLGDLPGIGITTVDADGVALAAIQGLYDVVRVQESEISRMEAMNAALRREIETLKDRLAALERR